MPFDHRSSLFDAPPAERSEIPSVPLLRMAAGDSRAVDELLKSHGAMLWSLALHSCHGNRADAEDAVQEILIDLWRFAHQFDPDRGGDTVFISMIARRRLIDRFRRRGPIETELDAETLAYEPDFVSALETVSDFSAMLRCMRSLRREERRVLRLGFFRGLSQTEIADRTGMPLGTVKSLMRRGQIRLRELCRPFFEAQMEPA